jgi:hypothetical protein
VGDHWDYGLEVAATGEEGVTVYAVTEDLGSDWRMDTDSAERAFQDARDDISRLGPQRKSDLAGSQGGDRVQFFRWPLTPGDSWAARWDHQDVTIQVGSVDARGAELTASNATQVVYRYTYDAAAGWFGSLRRFAPDGSLAVHLTLLASGHDWTGTVVRYALEPLVSGQALNAPGTLLANPAVPVGAGVTDLWLRYDVGCRQGVVNVGLRGPPQSGQSYGGFVPCSEPVSFADVVAQAPAAGNWEFDLSFADASNGVGGVAATYELVARTRTDVPVG